MGSPQPQLRAEAPMNVTRFIAELRKELVRIDEVILVIERLAGEQPKRRGRPPRLRLVGRRKHRARSARIPVDMVGTGQI
jgi:hypothetical protein